MGRYGSSQLAEVTVHPNGTLALIRSYQGLETLEYHSTHWDIYSNVGMEYAGRDVAFANATTEVGYGRNNVSNAACLVEFTPTSTAPAGSTTGFAPAANSCNDARDIIEGTLGFWYKDLQWTEGPRAVWSAILLPGQEHVGQQTAAGRTPWRTCSSPPSGTTCRKESSAQLEPGRG